MNNSPKKLTGGAIYIALSIFIERVVLGRKGELPAIVLPSSGPASYCAFLSGVPEVADAEMHAAANTVSEVARMVVAQGKAEGVIFTGDGQGLGFRLQSELSASLAVLVGQLNESVGKFVLIEQTPGAVLEGRGAGSLVGARAA